MPNTTKQIKLSGPELQQYQQIESSINHWSIEHTKAVLQAKRLQTAVESMYDGRMQLMNGILKEGGIDPTHVHQVHVNIDDGTVTIVVNDDVPNPAADDSEGEISPNATPV